MTTVTTRYGKLMKADVGGQRLVVQCGSAKFAAKANTVSLKTDMKSALVGYDVTWRSGAPSLLASGAWVRTTGTISGGKVVLTRATLGGAASGSSFWYKFLGY